MTFFQFLNTALLTYAPLWVIWKVNDNHSLRLILFTVLIYGASQLLKMIFLATFAPSLDEGSVFSIFQELLKAVGCGADVLGLYFLFRYVRGGDRDSRILDISLGWVLAEAVFQRCLPLWFASRQIEFSWLGLQIAIDSNISFVFRRAFVAASMVLLQLPATDPSRTSLILFIVTLCSWPGVRAFLELGVGLGAFIGLLLHLAASSIFYSLSKSYLLPSAEKRR